MQCTGNIQVLYGAKKSQIALYTRNVMRFTGRRLLRKKKKTKNKKIMQGRLWLISSIGAAINPGTVQIVPKFRVIIMIFIQYSIFKWILMCLYSIF